MPNDARGIFVDRQEASELFKLVCEYSVEDAESLCPILSFIGPPGCGKTTLLQHLRQTVCHAPDNRPLIPYARLDFTYAQAPKDIVSILVRLRDQLQQHRDEQNRHLIFPRFDIGAAFALASTVHTGQLVPEAGEIARQVKERLSIFGPFGEIRTTLNNLKRIPPLWHMVGAPEYVTLPGDVVQHLDHMLAWDWYKKVFQLRDSATSIDVLQRMYEICIEGLHDKEYFTSAILSSAFLDDLCCNLPDPEQQGWLPKKRIVLFLDGFEALMSESNPIGLQLLESLLPTEYYKRGETHPLLIAVGSQMRLIERSRIGQELSFEQSTERESINTAREYAQGLYKHWLAQVSAVRNVLQWNDLYLEYWLQDFTVSEAQVYLTRTFQQTNTAQLTQGIETLAQNVHTLTHGHPLTLSLVATEIVRAHARGDPIGAEEFQQTSAFSSLLSRFLDRLSIADQQKLILCAVPRVLDISTLQALLELQHELEAQKLWKRYSRYTIFRADSNQKLVMHPVVRMLLLRQMQPNQDPDSEYYRVHALLQEYFHRRATRNDGLAQIEEAYHAIALGDADPAIDIAASIQQGDPDRLWEPFIEAMTLAPTGLMGPETEQEAANALKKAQMNHTLRECVAAIILYTRLLRHPHEDVLQIAAIHYSLGQVYHALVHSDVHKPYKTTILNRAISYYKLALQIYTLDTRPLLWAATKYNLGEACYDYLEVTQNVDHAIIEEARSNLADALRVYTKDQYPREWLKTNQCQARIYSLAGRKLTESLSGLENQSAGGWSTSSGGHLPDGSPLQDGLPEASSDLARTQRVRRGHEEETVEFVAQVLPDPVPVEEPAPNFVAKKPTPTEHTVRPAPPGKRLQTSRPKRFRVWVIIGIVIIIFALVASFGLYYLLLGMAATNLQNTSLPNGLGLVQANGEEVGVSDGRVAFDVDPVAPDVRPDGALKKQAAQKLQAGDRSGAFALWQEAVKQDPSDAEAQIYLEDQKVINGGQPYITFVVAIAFLNTPYSRSLGRDSLQGAFIAQQEYNHKSPGPGVLRVRLLIANSGSFARSASVVAAQIAEAARADKTIKGVMGWSSSARLLAGIKNLTNAHLPVVSQSGASDQLTTLSPYYFRVIASNSQQGKVDAQYVERLLRQDTSKRLVVFEDPAESNSQTIVHSFEQQFTADGYSVAHTENYTVGNLKDHGPRLVDSLNYQPDLLYIPAPNASDMEAFLANLPTSGPYANLQVMGGSTTYDATNALQNPKTWDRVSFTAVAYPYEWSLLDPTAGEPVFFKEYTRTYDPENRHQGKYGFSIPSGYVMTSYDAISVLLRSSEIAIQQHSGQGFNGEDLLKALEQINGQNTVQGVSGQIAFDLHHNAINKEMVTLHVDAQGNLEIVSTEGCYIKGCP